MADLPKIEDYRNLRGAQKAAIVMLALGEEQCGRLFTMMHEDEIRDISSPSPMNQRKYRKIKDFFAQ